MEYRDQVLAYAKAEAALVLDDIAPEPILGLARQLYAAVRFQSVMWDWRCVETGNLLEDLLALPPEDFFWRLVEFGAVHIEDESDPDPYMVAAIDTFMAASPFRQSQVYQMLRERALPDILPTSIFQQPDMLPTAAAHRGRLIANWTFHRAGGPPQLHGASA